MNASHPAAPDGSGRQYEDHELRLVNGKPARIKVAEGFVAPGLPHEVGEAGFKAHKERIERMLDRLEKIWGVVVVKVRYKRQDPQPPAAFIDIHLPAYSLPTPVRQSGN